MGLFQSLLLLGTTPANELERTLLAFLKQKVTLDQFLTDLTKSRVFLLTKAAPSAPDSLAGITPLVIVSGGRDVLCVFTSPRRSSGIQRRVPAFGFGLEIEFRSVLKWAPAELGMAINAGTLFSMEATAQGLAELRLQLWPSGDGS